MKVYKVIGPLLLLVVPFTIYFTLLDPTQLGFEQKENTELTTLKNKGLTNKIHQFISDCGCTRKFLYPPEDEKSTQIPYNSSCSDEGTFYKINQNVVTFSLHYFSLKDRSRIRLYKEGIQLNLEKMRTYYPGYTMRVYTDVTLECDYCKFVCNNSDLFWCDIRKSPSMGNQIDMFMATWRFLTLGDPTVDVLLSRDLDSVITAREAAVVEDWLKLPEKKAIHLMRDKAKAHNVPILAGLWGAINSGLPDGPSLRDQIANLSRTSKKNKMLDQTILNKLIFYPKKNDIVAYDSYHCERWKRVTMVKPFPMRRNDTVSDFVGNYNLGRKKYTELPKCPKECRPSYGKDWEHC